MLKLEKNITLTLAAVVKKNSQVKTIGFSI